MIFLFLQCVSTVIIVYIIISPLNSYLYIHLDIGLKINSIIIIINYNAKWITESEDCLDA